MGGWKYWEVPDAILLYYSLKCRKQPKTRPASLTIAQLAKICTNYAALRAVVSGTANPPARNEAGSYSKSDPYPLLSSSENQSLPTRTWAAVAPSHSNYFMR